MSKLPPEDRPDEIDIGPVTGVPIIDDDDPRFQQERAAWSAANATAQALATAEELLAGVADDDWMVRHQSIDRLVARCKHDRRTLPALIRLVEQDPAWEVRDHAVMRLIDFGDDPRVVPALDRARADKHPEVRESVSLVWRQLQGRT